MNFVKGDVLDAKHGIICHQTNCQGSMGAGIARTIRSKFPGVFQEYSKLVAHWGKEGCLGKCQIIEVASKTLYIANLFGQYHYSPRNKQHTDYGALSVSLASLAQWHRTNCHPQFPVFFPHGIGCGLGGGNWGEVQAIINAHIPEAIIVRLMK